MAFNINAQVILSAPKNIQKVRQTISKGLSGISANIDLKVDTKSTSALKSINVELEAMKNNLKVINAAKISLGNFRQFSSQATKTATSLSSIGTASQKTNQALSKTSKQVKEATSDITNFGKESALATRRFAAFTIVSGGIFGLVRGFKAGVSQAINFEKQIIRVQQVTGDAGVGISGLKREIDVLSVSLGVASDELVGVALTLAQTGKTIPQIRSALTAIAKATLAPTFGDIKDTTEGVIAALEQFNIEASKTEEVLGSLNAVSKNFAVESADLISVIRRAGGVFAAAEPQFKGPQESLNELIALFTAVRSTTRESAETIATGLRTIFSRIQRPATVQFLRQFGVELVDAEGQFVGTFEAFKRIAAGIEGLRVRGDAIGLARIVEELGGIRQAGKIIPLLQNFTKAEDARRVALEGTASISEDVEIAQKSLGFAVDQLKQKFTKFIRDVVESKSFQNLARTILALGDNLLSVVDALRPLLPLFTTIATIKVSESLINFSRGFLGGFSKLGGAEGLGERIGGLGSVDTVGDSATQKVDRQVKETNNKTLIDNTMMVSKNTDSLVTLNTAIESLSTVSRGLITSIKSLESTMATTQVNQTPGGLILPPSAMLGSSPLKPPKRRSMGGPAGGNTLLKSGELVFDPEMVKKMGLANLKKMNQGVSMVGGNSPIDSIPADLDSGSFVLNKKNSKKFNQGGLARRTIADDLFAELDRNLGDVLEIPNEWLPENLRDNRTKKVSVARLVKKLNARDAKLASKSGRGVSAKFDSQRNIVQSSPERMAALESYRSQAERGEDIQYITPNEDKLYNSQMAFVKQMIREGMLTEEDFEPEEFAVGGMVAKQASGYTPYKLGDIRRRRRRSTDDEGSLTDQAKYYAMLRQKRFGRRFGGTDFEMEEFLEELKNKPKNFNKGGEVKFAGLFVINKKQTPSDGQEFFNFEGQEKEQEFSYDFTDYLKKKYKKPTEPNPDINIKNIEKFLEAEKDASKNNKGITPEEQEKFDATRARIVQPLVESVLKKNQIKKINARISETKTRLQTLPTAPELIELLEQKKALAIKGKDNYLNNIKQNNGKLVYKLGIGYPPEAAGKEVFQTAVDGFLASARASSEILAKSLGVGLEPDDDQKLLKDVGIFDVAGKVFEASVNQLGTPFDNTGKSDSKKGFDYLGGLGAELASGFNLKDFSEAPTDAKISFSNDNLNSIKNTKIPNLVQERLDALLDDSSLVTVPKDKKDTGIEDDLFNSLGISSDSENKNLSRAAQLLLASSNRRLGLPTRTTSLTTPEEIQSQTAKMSLSRGSGGNIKSASDSVSTILTPGELIFPPDEAKRAGLANLISFNKTGDPSFLNDFNPNNVSMVPGSGSTDTFPQMLPAGSFVVKKKSSETMGGGFQKLRAGGVVGAPQGLKSGGMAAPSLLGALGPAIPGLAMTLTQLGSIDFSNTQALFQNVVPMLGVSFGLVIQQMDKYKNSQEEYIKNQEALANSIPHLTDEVINAAKKLRSAKGMGGSISEDQERATRDFISKKMEKIPEKDRAKELTRIKDSLVGKREAAKESMGPLGRLQLGAKEGFAKGIFGAGTKGLAQNLTKLTKGLGIAAAASLAAGPIIDQFTSSIFKDNKRETLASGETGLVGKDASSRATASASLKGGVTGGAIGFTVGNAIFPGAGGAIGAAAGAFLGAVNSAVNAKFEQLKFENLLRISDASKKAAEALEKLKDISDAKQLEEYNESIGDLFKAQEEAAQAIVNESIRIASRSWGQYFSEGVVAFGQGLYSLGEGIASSVGDFFKSFVGGITPDKQQQIRTDTFAKGLENIDSNVLNGIVDNFSKIADQALSRLSADQLKELESLDSSNILDYISALEKSGDVYARETEALKQIVKARANISGKTILESVAPDNKKARSALLAPVEIFARELSQNKSIEQASKSAVGQFKNSVSGEFQNIFKEAQSLEDISEIFDKLSEESKRSLAGQFGLTASDLSKSMKALGEASGSVDNEIMQQLISTNALKAAMERVNKTIDAIGTAFNQLASRFGNITSDLSVAAGNLQIDLDNIFSASGGSLTRKQNVNVFDNITGRSIDEFEAAVDRLAKAAGLAADDMADIPATLVVAEKIPEILKKTVDAVKRQGISGATDISGVQLQDLFAKQIEAVSGISMDKLSDPIRESIMETFMAALGETGGRSAESGGDGAKLFSLKALEAAISSGKLEQISSDLMEKIKQEASALENAISAFQDTMYQAAEFQRRILDEQMNASMEILNRQQSINNRFRKFTDLNFDPLQGAINDQAARIAQLTGGQVRTTDPIRAAEQLLTRQRDLQTEKDTLEKRQAEMGPADAGQAVELNKQLGSVQQALESNSKAIEELKSSNEILEAATETLTKANEARMTARERAAMFASKIGDAKNPMELQEAMSDFLAPTIAASKMASGMVLSFKDFASIMGDPSQIQAAFNLSDMDLESTIANLMRGMTMTGGAQLLGPMLSQRFFGAGATMAGSSDEERAALDVVRASTQAADKLTEALSSENALKAIEKLDEFNMGILKSGEAAVEAGKKFQEFRRTMLEDLQNGGNGNGTAGSGGAGGMIPRNRGGIMRFNQGGMVPNSILTPGEAVFSPSMTKSVGYKNLSYFNKTGDSSALSGFSNGGISTVPGVGSTDSVPAYLPKGSFVVKKSSSMGLPGFNNGTNDSSSPAGDEQDAASIGTGTIVGSPEDSFILNGEVTAANLSQKLPMVEGINAADYLQENSDTEKAIKTFSFLQNRKNRLKEYALQAKNIDMTTRLKSINRGRGPKLEAPNNSTPPIGMDTFEGNMLKNYRDKVKTSDISKITTFKKMQSGLQISSQDKEILEEEKIQEHDQKYLDALATAGLKYSGADTGVVNFLRQGYGGPEDFVKKTEWNPFYNPNLQAYDSSLIQKDSSEDTLQAVKKIASTALDFLPVAGTLKAGVELWTGVDPVTGEEVPWWASAIGLAAGIIPDGGLIVAAAKGSSKKLKAVKSVGKAGAADTASSAVRTTLSSGDEAIEGITAIQRNIPDQPGASLDDISPRITSNRGVSQTSDDLLTSRIAEVSRELGLETIQSTIANKTKQLNELKTRLKNIGNSRQPRGKQAKQKANKKRQEQTRQLKSEISKLESEIAEQTKNLDNFATPPPQAINTSANTARTAGDVSDDAATAAISSAKASDEAAAATLSTTQTPEDVMRRLLDEADEAAKIPPPTAARNANAEYGQAALRRANEASNASVAGKGASEAIAGGGRGLFGSALDLSRRALGSLRPSNIMDLISRMGKGVKNIFNKIIRSLPFPGILRFLLKNWPEDPTPENITALITDLETQSQVANLDTDVDTGSAIGASSDLASIPSLDQIDYLKDTASKKMFVHFSKYGKAGPDLASESIYDMVYAKDSRKDPKFANVGGVAAKSAVADAKVAAEKMEIERILGLGDSELQTNPELFIHRREAAKDTDYKALTSGDVGVRGLKDYMNYQKMLLRLQDKKVEFTDDGTFSLQDNYLQAPHSSKIASRNLKSAEQLRQEAAAKRRADTDGQSVTPEGPTNLGSLLLDHDRLLTNPNDDAEQQKTNKNYIDTSAQLLAVQKTKQSAENDLKKLLKSKSNQKRLSRMGMIETAGMDMSGDNYTGTDQFSESFAQQAVSQLGVQSSRQQQSFWAGGNWGALMGQGMAQQTGPYGAINTYQATGEYKAPELGQSPVDNLRELHQDFREYKKQLIAKNKDKLTSWTGDDQDILLTHLNEEDAESLIKALNAQRVSAENTLKIQKFNEIAREKHNEFKNRTMQFLSAPEESQSNTEAANQPLNRGGLSTTPNAILTPGEAVFTPSMTKSLGYQNLSYFNKTGDTSSLSGFNSGGISKVPGVGSTDSVPAYLPTGSFVVKKSSSANLPGFNRGTASSSSSSMQKMIGDFISFTKTFFNNLSATLPTMKASETANSTTLAAEKKAGNVQQVNNDIILLPQKLDESFRVFDSVTTKFITNFNPLINQLDNAVTRLEALPALQVQLDAKVGPVEVVLNGVELLNAFGDKIKGSILGAVAQQIAKLIPNADGSPKPLT
jgi:TP901 family phage tail tape measure protein